MMVDTVLALTDIVPLVGSTQRSVGVISDQRRLALNIQLVGAVRAPRLRRMHS